METSLRASLAQEFQYTVKMAYLNYLKEKRRNDSMQAMFIQERLTGMRAIFHLFLKRVNSQCWLYHSNPRRA